MATHRLTPPTLLSTFLRLRLLDKVNFVTRAMFDMVILTALLMPLSWQVAVLWFGAVILDLYALLGTHRRLRADLDAVEYGKRQVMDAMAGQPGGAPIVMDAGAHCGCVHRFAWDDVAKEWRQVTVVEPNQNCPLVEAYAYH